MRKQSRGVSTLKGSLIGIVVVFVVVFGIIPYVARYFIHGKMSPEALALVERMKKPPQVPAEWAEVTPIPPETKAAMAKVVEVWETRTPSNTPLVMPSGEPQPGRRDLAKTSEIMNQMVDGPPLTEAERAAAADLVQKDRALIDATVALGARPDYDSAVMDIPLGSVEPAPFLIIQTGVKTALISARLDALDGQTSRGLATATSVLGLARRHPASELISQLIAIAVSSLSSQTVADIAAQCDDPDALRHALEEMQRLEAQVTVPMVEDIIVADMLGNLRALKREGYPVELDFSKPATELYDQSVEATMRYPEWKVQQLEPNDPLRAKYEEAIAGQSERNRGFSIRNALRRAGPYGALMRDMLMTMAIPNFLEASTREKVATARYRLAKLAVAERLAQVEGSAPAATPRDLVPKYLATEPQDPFSSGTFQRAAGSDFYSLGPDTRDDAGAVAYDATNGTLSRGDIVLRRP